MQPVTISPILSAEEKRGTPTPGGGGGFGGDDDRRSSPSSSLESPIKSGTSPRLNLTKAASSGGLGGGGAAAGTNGTKRPGRPPKKGAHIATNSLGSAAMFSPEPDPEEGPSGKRFRAEEKTEGGEELHRLMMFGATLNPSSGMAKEMTNVLQV
jgi:hypothetical protein